MTLNIPPAAGVKPHEASQRLRVLIKNLLTYPPQVAGAGAAWTETEQSHYIKQELAHRMVATDASISLVNSFLEELVETAKLRRPSLTRIKVTEAQNAGSLYSLARSIKRERAYHQEREAKVIKQANRLLAGGGGVAPTPASQKLEEIYSLIQVIPTIPSPTDESKSERTLRAITAVLKAHFGQLEGSLAQIDQPELPIILLQTIEKEIEKIVEVEKIVHVQLPPGAPTWTPATPAPSQVTDPHFFIWGSQLWTKSMIMDLHRPRAHLSLKVGSPERWNNGSSLFEDAIETLWHVRGRTSKSLVTLRDSTHVLASIGHGTDVTIAWQYCPAFEILSGLENVLTHSIIVVPGNANNDFGDPAHPGDPTGWNEGMCLFPEALEALRHVRTRYNDAKFTLRRAGEIYAFAVKNAPAEIVIGQHLIKQEPAVVSAPS